MMKSILYFHVGSITGLSMYVYFTTCPHGSLKIEGTTGSKILSGIILTVTCYALRLPERRTTYLWGLEVDKYIHPNQNNQNTVTSKCSRFI